MNPVLALEEQALLRDRLSTPGYVRYMQPFLEDTYAKKHGPVTPGPDGKPSGWHFCQQEMNRLKMAEAYYVAAEMMPLVRWAASGLNETDRFDRTLWPTDYGFLYFEEPLISTEMWGRTVVTKAITWGRMHADDHPGTYLVHYTDMDDDRDEVNADIIADAQAAGDYDKYQRMGRLHVHHLVWIPDDMRVGPETVVPSEKYAQYAVGDQTLAAETPNDGRFTLALLMMLNQTVTDVRKEETDRRAARRFRRMGLPSSVTVVRLRRHKDANRYEGETLVEWAHRWIVRGHWAWRHCGPDHAFAQEYEGGFRVRVWISPYIKGPDGAPLKQTEKVYALVR